MQIILFFCRDAPPWPACPERSRRAWPPFEYCTSGDVSNFATMREVKEHGQYIQARKVACVPQGILRCQIGTLKCLFIR